MGVDITHTHSGSAADVGFYVREKLLRLLFDFFSKGYALPGITFEEDVTVGSILNIPNQK
jgi:hypothetical protein